MIDWQKEVPDHDGHTGLWIGYVGDLEAYGVSISLTTNRYIILDLTDKPNLHLATAADFDTAEEAKDYCDTMVSCWTT
jgi:hypothetical protein